jgi:hypothetical protein
MMKDSRLDRPCADFATGLGTGYSSGADVPRVIVIAKLQLQSVYVRTVTLEVEGFALRENGTLAAQQLNHLQTRANASHWVSTAAVLTTATMARPMLLLLATAAAATAVWHHQIMRFLAAHLLPARTGDRLRQLYRVRSGAGRTWSLQHGACELILDPPLAACRGAAHAARTPPAPLVSQVSRSAPHLPSPPSLPLLHWPTP